MAKKPDLTDLTKKFDISGIVNNLKSMINAATADTSIDADPNDNLGMKIKEVSSLMEQVISTQAQQLKDLAKVNELLSGLFHDLQALREVCKEKEIEEKIKPEIVTEDDTTKRE